MKSNRTWFVLLAALYLAGYGWFLAYSNFLPYVTDNNETFSSLIHAANIYHFGVGKTFGLTDEAYGLSAAAHPYVYTHQGNFPRLFALLLYCLGARTAESQIVLTTFTIGLLGVCLAFSYFSRATDNRFALIFCLLLMSDYVMFSQWQVNTWQVWHVFFFFSSLLWVHELNTTHTRYWTAVGLLNFACLFYYEILFSVFVVTFCAVYATHRYHNRIGTLTRAWAVLAGGPAIGAAILVAQNVAYFGWDNFLTDLDLTYTGRNQALADADFRRQLGDFYDRNHIVFWHNIVDAGYLRSLPEMAKHFVNFNLIVYTPPLIASAVVAGFAWLMGNGRIAHKPFVPVSPNDDNDLSGGTNHRIDPGHGSLYLAAAFTTFAAAVLVDFAVTGTATGEASVLLLVVKLAVLLPLFVVTRKNFGRLLRSDPAMTYLQVMRALLFLLLAAGFVRVQDGLYDSSYAPLWEYVAARFGSMHLLQLSLIATVWLVAHVILDRTATAAPFGWNGKLRILGPYLVCGVAAYIVTAFLLPGYLKTVYLDRFAPLTIFFHLVPFALLIYVLAGYASNDIAYIARHWRINHRTRDLPIWWRTWDTSKHVFTTSPQSLLAITTLLFTVAYWVGLQSAYFERLPPDQFAFLKRLREPPFKGASFAVNTYAAPIAVETGAWAYFDPRMGDDIMEPAENGFEISRDLRLLWLADKDVNRDYLTPKYFLCIKPQYLKTQIASLGLKTPWPGCSRLPLTSNSRPTSPPALNHKIVAVDPSTQDRWAIVKMDWDYPPYLKYLDRTGHTIAIKSFTNFGESQRGESHVAFDIQYRFAQQQGKSESSSLFALYAASDSPQKCASAEDVRVVVTSQRVEDLLLPVNFQGIVRIGVTPRTETKSGKEYRSDPISIGKRSKGCIS